jgi:outer membrane protein TolC
MRRSGPRRGASAHHRLARLVLAGATLAGGTVLAQTTPPAPQAAPPAAAAPAAVADAAVPVAVPAPVPDSVPAVLDQRGFLQILTLRNADIRYSRLGAQAAAYVRDAEAAMYEPVVFATVRQEGRERQRTFEERLQNLQTASTEVLDEQVNVRELGVRGRLPSGGELSAAYRMTDRQNNLIALSRNSNEYTGGLVLTFKQPLLRGRGRDVTETDRRIAELEHALAVSQLQQQMQKVGADALAVYWQVYKAQETVRYREASQGNTQRLIEDTRQRIEGGRVPASALLDLQSVLLTRESELLRARQALGEAQVKLFTTLNLPASRPDATTLQPMWTPPGGATGGATGSDDAATDAALATWAPLRQAEIRREQAQTRLAYAANQIKPQVDLVVSYSGTGLGYRRSTAQNLATSTRYPDWFVGLNMELPAYGNDRAKAQYQAQAQRRDQAELEIGSIRLAFANDLRSRWLDVRNATEVLANSEADHALRVRIDAVERERYRLGTGSLSAVIQKEAEMIEAALRRLDSQVRLEVALATLQYLRGELLAQAGITME